MKNKNLFIYFHLIHFPSESAQTIQVLRDYYFLSKEDQLVYLFFKQGPGFESKELSEVLNEYYGLGINSNFHMIRVNYKWFEKIRLLLKTLKIIKSFKNNEVFLITRTLNMAIKALLLRKICSIKGLKVKILFELHETAFPHIIYAENKKMFNSILSYIKEKTIFRNVDGLICTVKSQLDILDIKFSRHAPAIILPNGVLPESIRKSTGKVKREEKQFVLKYAGQFNEWKNIDIMIEALKYLPSFVVLEIAGGKITEFNRIQSRLNNLASKIGVMDRLKYIGFLPPSKIQDFLADANVLILPLGDNPQSKLFTSPMKLFEYAASGVPMVVTKQPTTLSLIKDRIHALMVEPCSPISLAQAIRTLIDDKNLSFRLAYNALQWVKQYAYDNRSSNYLEFVKNL